MSSIDRPDFGPLQEAVDSTVACLKRVADDRDRYLRDRNALRATLLRNGFVQCDIPACNCGDWHARFGLRERMDEIKDELAEAGHPLRNENGNLTLNALRELIAERDGLVRKLEEIASLYENGRDETGERASQAYDMRCIARSAITAPADSGSLVR